MESYKPHIGKNVIETLTLGMYENAFFIYREYVQNAADQIDVAVEEGILSKKSDGHINILIDKKNKSLSIEDNATGIKSKEVLQFLGDVANSQKDRNKRKGFRGIGRLGGLGYCQTLIFETSYKGEGVKSIISLDAKQLKEIIDDRTITFDASTVISVITSLKKEEERVEKHYFKVKLIDVIKDELLNDIEVKNYLSMVAPIPFKKDFTFSEEIHKYFKSNNVKIEEYDVNLSLNDDKLYKAYKNKIHSQRGFQDVEIIDIGFIELRNVENELIVLGWYGISDLLNNIIHPSDFERGIRVRKDNIQIGDEDTLKSYFKADRFNHHFIGEVYVIGNEFIPNARRDFFNENSTVKTFKKKLKSFFVDLDSLAHASSDIHSGKSKILAYKKEKEIYENTNYKTEYEEKQKIEQLEKLKDAAEKGQLKMSKSLTKALSNDTIKEAVLSIYKYKVGNDDLSIDNTDAFNPQEYEKPVLSKLNDSTNAKEVVFDIFKIIEENADAKTVVKLKKKIVDLYN